MKNSFKADPPIFARYYFNLLKCSTVLNDLNKVSSHNS